MIPKEFQNADGSLSRRKIRKSFGTRLNRRRHTKDFPRFVRPGSGKGVWLGAEKMHPRPATLIEKMIRSFK